VSARNRVFMILGILAVGSLIWYLVTTKRTTDLQLIGTVDANEVVVSAKIPGRIQTLLVNEGDVVKAGQLIAVIESDDLSAAERAAEANAASEQWKLTGSVDTVKQTRGETGSAAANAAAMVMSAQATLAQAKAQYDHQQADTSRAVGLAQQGIVSAQVRDEQVTALEADKAAIEAAQQNVAAAEAALKEARAHEMLTDVAARTVDSTRDAVANAKALAEQAKVEVGYSQVFAPVSGKVNVWAARQGEVVGAGAPIVTIMDLTQTWIYAPLPETEADSVQLGDSLRVVMPSGATVWAKVINKLAEADFATQRDVSSRKRDIMTIQLKLLIDNPGEKWVPGMTAEVYVPKDKLVKQ